MNTNAVKYAVQQDVVEGESANSQSFRATPHPGFSVPTLIPALAAKGFELLPGLTKWFDALNPARHPEAWAAFTDKKVIDTIRNHPQQQKRYCLNDSNELDASPQLSINFEAKKHKSHLTISEGAEAISDCPLLPNSIKQLLKAGNDLNADFRKLLADILPPPSFPTLLKVRIFEYCACDLAHEIPFAHRGEAMRPHVDGTICTLIIAQSDGLLHFAHQGQWYSAICPNGKPFAVIIPGLMAEYEYGVQPTPHMVLAGAERRTSVTIALTPALSGCREEAENQIERWRLLHSKPQDEITTTE